jgi:hypothetical protein
VRVLVLPLNADHRQEGMLCAFRRVFGEGNVIELDYCNVRDADARMLDILKTYSIGWVFMHLNQTEKIGGRLIEQARAISPHTVFSHWMGDWRASVSPKSREICATTDVTFISSQGQLGLYRAVGAKRVEYLQIGLDWAEDVLGLPPWSPPFRVPHVVLCGNWYAHQFPGGGDRMKAVQALQNARIDVGVVGSGWPAHAPFIGTCGVKQQHHVYKRALVALSCNNINDCRLYYSDRQLVTLASGTPTVCHYVPGLEEEFLDGKHCLFYRNETELCDRVLRLIRDEGLRDRIGAAGRAEVIARHTWKSRVEQAFGVVQNVMETR